MTQAPIDHDSRLAIRHELDRTCFVEAGAGTGKTTELVQRIVELFRTGRAEPRDVAAITFTEAAAGELRERVRLALEQARRASPVGTEERTRLDRAVAHLDEAHISTVHAFAQAILAEHAISAGLPPRFDIIDELESEIAFDLAWSEFFGNLLDEDDLSAALTTGYLLGLTGRHLHALARALHADYHHMRAWTPPAAALHQIDLNAVIDAVAGCVARAAQCTDLEDGLYRHLTTTVEPWLHTLRLVDPADQFAVIDALIDAPKLKSRSGRANVWGGDAVGVRTECAAAAELVAHELTATRRSVLEVVLPALRGFALGVVDERLADGRVEFHDLLVLTRNLLRDHPEARTRAGERYRVLLIDEFQDTDPLQAEIAVLLAASVANAADDDVSSVAPHWIDAAVGSGRLFFVGDPKQSIYRFRHADLGVYHAALDAHAERTLELVANWRSVPAVIKWVNHVFAELMTPPADAAFGTTLQAQYRPLHAGRPPIDHPAPPVAVFGGEQASKAAEVRAAEAADVAAMAATVHADHWPVVHHGTERAAQFGDIAILLPNRTLLPALEAALEAAGVPARVESRSLVYSTAEVRDLATILHAIDDPTDAIAVVGALRTSFFGVSDAELVEFSRAGGRFDPRREPPAGIDPSHPVAVALTRLQRWYEARWWKSVHETLADVVHELDVFTVLTAHHRPRDRWRRVRFLQEQARAFVDANAGDLRSFVDWLTRQREERAASTEDAVPDPDDDAVRILTVHGAKGLEFPVVILAGLGSSPRQSAPTVIWTESGPEIRIGSEDNGGRFETVGFDAARDREQAADDAESIRLLYVAATRARDHLLVSLHRGERATRSPAALLAPLAEALGTPTVTPTVAQVDPARIAQHDDANAAAALVAGRSAWSEQRTEQLAALRSEAVVSPTDVAKQVMAAGSGARDTPWVVEEQASAEGPPWRRGRAGTALGRAVHAALQDAVPGTALTDLARSTATAEGIPDLADEVAQRTARALASPVVEWAMQSAYVRREVPISALVEDVLVEGIIDLLAITHDQVVVIDYKTDTVVGDTAIASAVSRYAPQLATYACALEAVLGRPVTDAYLVFAGRDRAHEVELADLAEQTAQVRSLLRDHQAR
ncbi:MAG: UvrD-helicase domain-containing protein [Acidimicrobiia bacterium]